MSRFTHLAAVIALIAAAAPLHAQNGTTRYEAGSFVIDVPQGVQLARVQASNQPSVRSETFTGGNPTHGLVVVMHTILDAVSQDVAVRSPAAAQQVIRDTARARAAIEAPRDTSRALQQQLRQMLGDTSLSVRRTMLLQSREVFRIGSRNIVVTPEAREIVTDNRIALRSPVAVRLDATTTLVGTADVSFPRRGQTEMWIVIHANTQGTPDLETASARILDSFRITGAPTSVPVAPNH